MSTLDSSSTTESTDVTDTLVEIRELKKYYGGGGFIENKPVKAVDGVSFDIRRGETLGLVGESGCGKTTLGRTLIRLEQATEGNIRYEDKEVTELSGTDLKQWRRNVQMVFQDPDSSLNDRMTIGEIVQEVFGDVDLPGEVEGHIETAVEHVRDGNSRMAREYLHEEFGSECEREPPDDHEVSESGQTSRCHRHKPEHESPESYLHTHVLDE